MMAAACGSEVYRKGAAAGENHDYWFADGDRGFQQTLLLRA
jgi:hypothetical protein